MSRPNHPFVVLGSSFLWFISMVSITWALFLFFCMGDMLLITGADLVIALVLLSGLIMLPTNIYMLLKISKGETISAKSRVMCCPLWMITIWIIVINCLGIAVCVHKICVVDTKETIAFGMTHYRSVPKYKHFVDNLQWSLKCCGIDSYKDWFHQDWYEKIRDYELDPTKKKTWGITKIDSTVSDSVPLSCCKSGTCVPNYLLELGTHSIHTKGCSKYMLHAYMISMNIHLIIFLSIVIVEIILLTCILGISVPDTVFKKNEAYDVRHLMPVNNKFEEYRSSCSICPEDSDIEERREFRAKKGGDSASQLRLKQNNNY